MNKRLKDIIISIILIASFTLICFKLDKGCNKSKEVNIIKVDSISNTLRLREADSKISEGCVLNNIKEMNIKYPKVVLAQARLESGNFTSSLFKRTNNMFGMNVPNSRTTTSIGEYKGHAVYAEWGSSIFDYKLWQDNVFNGKTLTQYYDLLSRVYAEDSCYVDKLKKIVAKYD